MVRARWHGARATAVCVAIWAFVGPAAADAQPAKPAAPSKPMAAASPEDAAASEARARFNEGVAYAEAGDHEAARLKFVQAWLLLKSPIVLYNLARAEQLSGHTLEAFEHFRLFGKMGADPKITEVQRERTAEYLAELSKKIGQIAIAAPSNARLFIDGRTVEATGEPIGVAPGRHVVDAVVEGEAKSITVECPAGVVTTASFLEQPTPPRARPPSTSPSSSTGANPAERPASFWTTGRVGGTTLAGAGLIALGLGVVFHVGASEKEDLASQLRATFPAEERSSACSVDPSNRNCIALRAAVDEQRAQEGLRTGFLIGAGALVVGGTALFLASSPRSPAAGSARLVPVASDRDAGLLLMGRF